MKRQIYLSMKELTEARKLFFDFFGTDKRTGEETIPAYKSLGRVTSKAVFAQNSAPTFHSAAMDGIALQADQTFGATERFPKVLEIGRDAIWINTGQAMPNHFDSVIMIEKLHQLNEDHVEIRASAYPWQNVRKVGEDIVATELLFSQDHKLRAYDLGALVSAGVFLVKVWQKPKVAIIPTGSELVNHRHLEDGDALGDRIIEFNSLILGGLVRECNAIPVIYDIVPDQEELIYQILAKAAHSDAHMIIINAGSSAGSKDYTRHIIDKMGEVFVHGVAMMPGKPTLLGRINGKPVVGNPGYPVSSIFSFEQFVKPLLYSFQGRHPYQPETLEVYPTRDIPSKLGIEEFLRINLGQVGNKLMATPLPRAAGSITTLTRAEGILRIPAMSEGLSQNETAIAELLVSKEELLNTIVIIGSHDITIDILANEVLQQGSKVRISSGNVGSLGGLIALRKGSCHIAGSHLLDPESGQYNITYVKRYLNGMAASIFNLVLREQGLIIPAGNPKGIKNLSDLCRDDIIFVNRQAGSGTRVLLDYKLKEKGIKPQDITGYNHDEFTHMAVAVDVLSGAADCGLGIMAGAKALNLDFIPMVKEQYDLIIPNAFLGQPNVQVVLETIRSDAFRQQVISLGGYDPSKSGRLWKKIN